jgi:intron-binding protein aquarius
VPPNPGPYPQDIPKKNAVPFTPVQVEAIRSGINSGLTLVVGPPGTGKTDVATQIISNLYHTFPEQVCFTYSQPFCLLTLFCLQRTLFVTHSNTALNHLFEKIMALDINERHLLRLGHGQEMLETEKDFSKWGRVNYMLGLRVQQLAEVERLATSLNVAGDVGYTCETAAHFYLFHVLARWYAQNFLFDNCYIFEPLLMAFL